MENQILDENILESQVLGEEQYQIAPIGKRFGNYLIDMIVLWIIGAIIQYIIIGPMNVNVKDIGTNLGLFMIQILVMVLYFTVFESYNGKTIGKMITGTRVLNIDFTKPSAETILKRSLCRIIPFEPFSYLGSTNGWHDSIMETTVVFD